MRNRGLLLISKNRSRQKIITCVVLVGLLIKGVIILKIPAHILPGADGSNYIEGVNALVKDGIFSHFPNLLFWPAGYPITIFVFVKVFGISQISLGIFAFAQSLYFAIATYLIAKELLKTKLQNYSVFFTLLLTFNPTLSSSSLTTGYESIFASSLIIIAFLVIRDLRLNATKNRFYTAIWIGLVGSFAGFLEPKVFAFFIPILIIWLFKLQQKKIAIGLFSLSCVISLIMPAGLVIRNIQSGNPATISTNLGDTMAIGAGPKAYGGYKHTAADMLQCNVNMIDKVVQDRQLVLCTLNWYFTHPARSIDLFYHKTLFYLSPWSPPLAEGTTALNPWLKIDPVILFAKSHGGIKFLFMPIVKVISWLWVFGGIFFFWFGFYMMKKIDPLMSKLAWILLSSCTASLFISILSIGDNRFRLPLLGYSIFLQGVGLMNIKKIARFLKILRKQNFKQTIKS